MTDDEKTSSSNEDWLRDEELNEVGGSTSAADESWLLEPDATSKRTHGFSPERSRPEAPPPPGQESVSGGERGVRGLPILPLTAMVLAALACVCFVLTFLIVSMFGVRGVTPPRPVLLFWGFLWILCLPCALGGLISSILAIVRSRRWRSASALSLGISGMVLLVWFILLMFGVVRAMRE